MNKLLLILFSIAWINGFSSAKIKGNTIIIIDEHSLPDSIFDFIETDTLIINKV